MKTLNHWIGGKPVEGASGSFGPVYDPATGAQDHAGRASPPSTRSTPPSPPRRPPSRAGAQSSLAKRTAVLFKFRELLDAHRDEIAELITAEHGKVHSDALGEVARGLEIVELACGITAQLKGELSTQVSTRVDVASIRQPLGVVAGITPFNFPAMVPMWMFPLAIACGNTFVLKPSEKDPSASYRLAELAAEAGLPGRRAQRRAAATRWPWTGCWSTRTSRRSPSSAPRRSPSTSSTKAIAHGKRVQALGGAKNHMLVLPDADLDFAADQAINAAYGSAGERCMAVSVVVAVGDTGDELVGKIAERAEKLQDRPRQRPGLRDGPADHRASTATRSRRTSAARRAQGAEVVVDGTGYTVEGHEDGFFLGVSLLDKVPADGGRVPGRDLRPGAVRGARRHLRGGHRR